MTAPILRNGGYAIINGRIDAEIKYVPLADIRIPDNHVTADLLHAGALAALLNTSETVNLPPVLVTPAPDGMWLIDGRHRYIAHIIAGRAYILAVVADVDITTEQKP